MTRESGKMLAALAPRTGQRPLTMPQRSDHPGLKWRNTTKGKQPYWVAKQVVRDPMGYPDKTIRLDCDASGDELAEQCRHHTAKLLRWMDDIEAGRTPDVRYDGTIGSLAQIFQTHDESPFHSVKRNTRKSYT